MVPIHGLPDGASTDALGAADTGDVREAGALGDGTCSTRHSYDGPAMGAPVSSSASSALLALPPGGAALSHRSNGAVRSRLRMWLCTAINGGHEYWIARTPDRICLQCVCGHQTPGWTIANAPPTRELA